MTTCFVVGASGAVGRFLLPRLAASGHAVCALSRRARDPDASGVRWIVGRCDAGTALPPCNAVISVGPLDAFAAWFATQSLQPGLRVIAIGSTSIDSKRASHDAGERDVAQRLDDAERSLHAHADANAVALTLLRPTLIYGAGVDRSLSPIARFAMRWRVLPHFPSARGLRQPVHADDLAAACVTLLDAPRTHGRVYALGGGERLTFDAMLLRLRRSLPRWSVALPLPLSIASAGLGLARAMGLRPSRAAIDRMGIDLVADHAAAVADFAWAPRRFEPRGDDWLPHARGQRPPP